MKRRPRLREAPARGLLAASAAGTAGRPARDHGVARWARQSCSARPPWPVGAGLSANREAVGAPSGQEINVEAPPGGTARPRATATSRVPIASLPRPDASPRLPGRALPPRRMPGHVGDPARPPGDGPTSSGSLIVAARATDYRVSAGTVPFLRKSSANAVSYSYRPHPPPDACRLHRAIAPSAYQSRSPKYFDPASTPTRSTPYR